MKKIKTTKKKLGKSMNYHNVLLLDRSGSMSGVTKITQQGINENFATLKNMQKETDATITQTMFGFESSASLISAEIPVKKLKKVGDEEVFGRGGTCMLNAIYESINQISIPDGEPVLYTIFTDGDTGGDSHSWNDIKDIIKSKQSKGWTFVYVGPIGSNRHVKALGIPETNAMEYQTDASGFRSAFYKLSRGIRKYYEALKEGKSVEADFFNDEELQKTEMKSNGMKVTINMPESVSTEDENSELPPYAPVPAYVVDEYPSCPTNWMHGSAKASSYFVPVTEGNGMWLDFNGNADNEHEIAVVISVQGVNPINGQKTSTLRLEKYDNKCPIHDVDFHQERYCPSCKFKWPSQNYISTTGAPRGQFWLDGFRTQDGKVRQYVFTEEMARGVAKAVVGEDRVFAIGMAFYKSKKAKPKVNYDYDYSGRGLTSYSMSLGSSLMGAQGPNGPQGSGGYGGPPSASAPQFFSPTHTPQNWQINKKQMRSMRDATKGGSESVNYSCSSIPMKNTSRVDADAVDSLMDMSDEETESLPISTEKQLESMAVTPKNFEVAAGAQIEQDVHADPNKLDFWDDEPIALVYVNYSDLVTVKKILAAGKREEAKEGFLAGVPVGN